MTQQRSGQATPRKMGDEKAETGLLRDMKRLLELRGFVVVRVPVGAVMQRTRGGKLAFAKSPLRGFPDLMGWFRDGSGRSFVVEVKTEKGKVAPHQQEWLDSLSKLGVFCLVGRDPVDVLKRLLDAERQPIGSTSA